MVDGLMARLIHSANHKRLDTVERWMKQLVWKRQLKFSEHRRRCWHLMVAMFDVDVHSMQNVLHQLFDLTPI